MSKNNISQKSIAKNLNLSVATVSKALNDSSEINSNTRAKVVNMATQLGYRFSVRPERDAHKSRLVGVLINSKPGQWQHNSYFEGMSEKCAKLNVSLTLHYFSAKDCERVLDPEYQPPVMRDGQLSGLILVNRWPEHIVAKLVEKTPCVSIMHRIGDIKHDLVGTDDFGGVAVLAEHLHDFGHRKIGFFGRCDGVAWARKRFSAYFDSLCRMGLEYNEDNVFEMTAEQIDDQMPATDAQVDCVAAQIHQGVRAWMCPSDWAGYTLCRGLMDRGFDVPKDVSVTGFDDIERDRLGCPRLTTVSTPALKIGAEALRRLITRVRHPNRAQLDVRLQCKLIEGATAGPLSSDD